MNRPSLTLLLLALSWLVPACGEDPPPPPPTTQAPPPEPPPTAPPLSECDVMCDRVMACDLADLGDRGSCVRRCQTRAPRDVQMLRCLQEPTPDGARRCDLALRCTEVWVERRSRPTAIAPERERLDARALGPELEISLESRLLNASPESSRYDLVLLVRGRGQWDGGVGDLDAGAPLDAGPFDGGIEAPDVWVRLGAYTSDGRLPLVRAQPRPASDDADAPYFVLSSYWAGTGDSFRIRRVRDELVVEHAFLQDGGSGGAQIESDLSTSLRIQLAPGAHITARREIVP